MSATSVSNDFTKTPTSIKQTCITLWKRLYAGCHSLITPWCRSRISIFRLALLLARGGTRTKINGAAPVNYGATSQSKECDGSDSETATAARSSTWRSTSLFNVRLCEERATSSQVAVRRTAQKKALLIGIEYRNTRRDFLPGAIKNVLDLKQILIDLYGYKEEDITIMRDDIKGSNLYPTRANIYQQMNKLVKDAQPEDHFLFHFAGHGTQMEVAGRRQTEEDGMDEAIIPVDDDPESSRLIRDNSLCAVLLRPLPAGSTLVAIFDTCNSGSLLDLEHSQCNRIWMPHVSVNQRKTDPIPLGQRTCQLRQNGILELVKMLRKCSSRKEHIPPQKTTCTPSSTKSSRITRLTVKIETFEDNGPTATSCYSASFNYQFCTSPVRKWRACTGYCKLDPVENLEKPTVICISACEDGQITWQNARGESITSALVAFLRQNQQRTRKEVLTGISHWVHEQNVRLHDWSRKQWEEGAATPIERYRFQNPQFSSNQRLDLDAPFVL